MAQTQSPQARVTEKLFHLRIGRNFLVISVDQEETVAESGLGQSSGGPVTDRLTDGAPRESQTHRQGHPGTGRPNKQAHPGAG